MGAYKVLVTFATKKDMDEALRIGLELLLNHFKEVKPWVKEELCQTRRTCMECYGIPPHAWSKENIMKIVEV